LPLQGQDTRRFAAVRLDATQVDTAEDTDALAGVLEVSWSTAFHSDHFEVQIHTVVSAFADGCELLG
jgi:hypothetical protein